MGGVNGRFVSGCELGSYMLNTYSRIPVTQSQEYDNVFRLVIPVSDRNPYIFKVDVFTTQAKYE